MNNGAFPIVDPVLELSRRLTYAGRDSDRLTAFREYLPAIVIASPADAVVLATEADRVITRLRAWNAEPEILRHRGAAYLRLNNPAAAMTDLSASYTRYNESGRAAESAAVLLLIAEAHMMLGAPQCAEEELLAALASCGPAALPFRAEVLEAIGNFYLAVGEYARAMEHLREALGIHEERNDQGGIGRALYAIAAAHGKLNDLEGACEQYSRSLEAFRAAGDVEHQSRALANLACIQQARGHLQEALATAAMAHAQCDILGDWAGAASMRITMADVHLQLGEQDIALRLYLEAYKILQQQPPDDLHLELYHRLGRIHQASGDLAAAQLVYTHALTIADTIGDRRMMAQFHEAMASVLERLGDYKEALEYHRKFAALREEIAGEEQRRAITELRNRYEREKAERERRIAEMDQQQLREEINARQEELEAALLNRAQSNAKLEKVKADVRQLGKAGAGGSDAAAERIVEDISREDVAGPGEDNEWKQLERLLDRREPGFIRRLFELCPSLTPTEVKICALARLDYDTNAIAGILHNGLRTVQTQRWTIRKKFGLNKEVNFTAFIKNL